MRRSKRRRLVKVKRHRSKVKMYCLTLNETFSTIFDKLNYAKEIERRVLELGGVSSCKATTQADYSVLISIGITDDTYTYLSGSGIKEELEGMSLSFPVGALYKFEYVVEAL